MSLPEKPEIVFSHFSPPPLPSTHVALPSAGSEFAEELTGLLYLAVEVTNTERGW